MIFRPFPAKTGHCVKKSDPCPWAAASRKPAATDVVQGRGPVDIGRPSKRIPFRSIRSHFQSSRTEPWRRHHRFRLAGRSAPWLRATFIKLFARRMEASIHSDDAFQSGGLETRPYRPTHPNWNGTQIKGYVGWLTGPLSQRIWASGVVEPSKRRLTVKLNEMREATSASRRGGVTSSKSAAD